MFSSFFGIKKHGFIIVLFAVFIFLLPTQLAKHFWPDFAVIHSIRIDYLAPKLYVTDILAGILIFFYRHNIQNNIWYGVRRYRYVFMGAILFLIAHILFSLSPVITMLKILKVLEVIGVGLCVYHIFSQASAVGRSRLRMIFFIALLGGALFQLYLVLLQVFFHSSMGGIFYYFGERAMTMATGNIATASWQGVEFLRPYGTFSHPNSLGGFYLLIYFLAWYDRHLKKNMMVRTSLLSVSSLLVLCSFSKVVIGTYIFLTIISFILMMKKTPCVFCIMAKIMVFCVIAMVFMMAQGDVQTLSKRIWLAWCAIDLIGQYPFLGSGLGTYLLAQSNFPVPYPHHFLQPVHNIILLIIAQIGIPAAFAGLYGVVVFIKKYGSVYQFLFCVLVVLITGMADHYWLTLQQNWLVLGVVFGYAVREGQKDG